MTSLNRHHIQRQVIDLRTRSHSQASAMQSQLARAYWERLVGELETVFDRVAGPHERLRLEHLQVDLGEITDIDWEPTFCRRLVQEMARRLAQFKPVSGSRSMQEQGVGQMPEPLQVFLFFLEKGRLPWWARQPGEGWTDAVSPVLNEVGWVALGDLIVAELHARARLVDSTTDAFLEAALYQWAGLPHAALVLERLAPKEVPAAHTRGWRRRFWSTVFDWICAEQFQVRNGSTLLRDLINLRRRALGSRAAGTKTSPPAGDLPAQTEGATALVILPEPWHGWQIEAAVRSPLAAAPKVPPEGGPAGVDADNTHYRSAPEAPRTDKQLKPVTQRSEEPEALYRSAPGAPRTDKSLKQVTRRPEDAEAIYLEGAGAIILHPFLETLFRDRSLLEERDFPDATARAKAVHLLGWMTFARADVREHELLLAKVLCGSEFAESLEPIELDDGDRTACDTLLQAVLEHWAAARSSSADWLRAGFLSREGKLERVDQGWRLTVERHAQDVLLARLPWGFGVVGLPWQRERIFVHWLD